MDSTIVLAYYTVKHFNKLGKLFLIHTAVLMHSDPENAKCMLFRRWPNFSALNHYPMLSFISSVSPSTLLQQAWSMYAFSSSLSLVLCHAKRILAPSVLDICPCDVTKRQGYVKSSTVPSFTPRHVMLYKDSLTRKWANMFCKPFVSVLTKWEKKNWSQTKMLKQCSWCWLR